MLWVGLAIHGCLTLPYVDASRRNVARVPGKYIKLQYGASWKLGGARTLPFLLEKSRLVHQERNERNYHVFYQLCRGVSKVQQL